MEVGFAEKYKKLKSNVRLWLEGSSEVYIVIIVGFLESLSYYSLLLIHNDDREELDPQEIVGILSDFTAIRRKDVVFKNKFSLVTYKGLR